MKAIIFTGPFTTDELAELTEALRRIEQRDPARHFNVVVNELDHEPSITEAAELVERIFPRLPGQRPEAGQHLYGIKPTRQ
jgi:hypothetical protein